MNALIIINTKKEVIYINKKSEEFIDMASEDFINMLSKVPLLLTGMDIDYKELILHGRKLIISTYSLPNDNIAIILQDVSGMEFLKKELIAAKQLNDEMETVIESIHDEIYIVDAVGKTIKVNSSACRRFYGLEPSELIGKDVHELSESGLFYPVTFDRVVKEKRTVTEIQTTQSGREIFATVSPVFDRENNVIKVVTVSKDMTEVNQLRRKLQESQGLIDNYQSQLASFRNTFSANFIYNSNKMKKVLELATKVAKTDTNILIIGETGAGKGALADFIHSASKRSAAPLIIINCGAVPENLLESEFYGYEKGAFTGANKDGKLGLFELANGGTLVLDEISELPLRLQVKLLQSIQNKSITRIGGRNSIKIDFRLIAISNKPLEKLVKTGEFREDLYYRLNVIQIEAPPLRERKEEVFFLATHFLKKNCERYNKKLVFSPQAIDLLTNYSWPGNVRELENLIERLAITVEEDEIAENHLPAFIKESNNNMSDTSDEQIVELKVMLEGIERQLIARAYKKYKSTYRIAEVLNISQSSAARKIKKYSLQKES